MNVVLGASGCVGSRLIRRLHARGEPVRALVRREGVVLPPGVGRVRGDLLRPETLEGLFRDARTIYYLVHAMGKQDLGGTDLARDDRLQARNALEVARREAGSPRLVYVSGLGAAIDAPSAHLRGRWAVEDEVRASELPHVIVRAGVLLGPGSVGFEFLLRYVRIPLVPLPPWTELRMQPFALADLLDLLERAGRDDALLGRTIEVGTECAPTYEEFLVRAARAMGQSPITVRVPLGLEPVTPVAVAIQGAVPLREAAALTESMIASPYLVSDGGRAMRELGIPERKLEDALRLALRDAVAESVA